MESILSLTLYVQRVVVFLYVVSHCLLLNLTNMHQKPSACFGLRVDMVPIAYQCLGDEKGAWALSSVSSCLLGEIHISE
jgi:hypothetical protein